MIALSLQTLAVVVNGTLIAHPVEHSDSRTGIANSQIHTVIHTVTTDSRNITDGCLFIALKGERYDGHDFAHSSVAAGAVALLVSQYLAVNAPQILVQDTRQAMHQLAAWVRQQVPARVVALTGSSGKTSVTAMTAAILRQCGSVLSTHGNFNNDIGVPLTLLRLTADHDFAVIELGANHPGEIACTANLSRPHSVLVNNLSAAHLQGFGSLAGVAEAKGEIFSALESGGIAIINADSHDWPRWQALTRHKKVWRFSLHAAAGIDFSAAAIVQAERATHFTLLSPFGEVDVILPLPGLHNVANALAAAALAMSVGATLTAVCQGLAQLQPLPGRLFPLQLALGKLLLDDSYNANVGSMTAAALTLASMPGYRVMVVGDMAELGDAAQQCHRQAGEAIRLAGIDKVLSVGPLSKFISDASGRGEHFQDQAALAVRLSALLTEHSTITALIKGSRSAAMENIVRTLQEVELC